MDEVEKPHKKQTNTTRKTKQNHTNQLSKPINHSSNKQNHIKEDVGEKKNGDERE